MRALWTVRGGQRDNKVMAAKVWVTLENAYWVGGEIHTDVEGAPLPSGHQGRLLLGREGEVETNIPGAQVAQFKNDFRDLGTKYVRTMEGVRLALFNRYNSTSLL